jgi:hypothetical protein
MTLSRTARILLALLLLAAAAFFWVNFFTQNRVLGEDPETPSPPPSTADPTRPTAREASPPTPALKRGRRRGRAAETPTPPI